MAHLKNKSKLNLCAAELLHEQSYYPSVVHCAYYSCIQLMRHTWLYSMGKTDKELRDINKNSKQGSHEVLINQIKSFINSKYQDDRTFNKDILQLKRLRVKADYDDSSIKCTESEDSIKLSKSTLEILTKCI